jgi:Raf kinase inhibitor-like YbhB/YbcL family protein
MLSSRKKEKFKLTEVQIMKGVFVFSVFIFFFLVLSKIAYMEAKETKEKGAKAFQIKSSAFKNGERIPKKYTCEGEDVSPPVEWSGAPEGTKSFVLIVDDPDAPIGTFNHWVVYDIPASKNSLPEGVQKKPEIEGGIKQGRNDFGKIGWGGPCPPPGHGTHRYFFKIKAISQETLRLPLGASKSEVLKAIDGKVLGEAEFFGTYSR